MNAEDLDLYNEFISSHAPLQQYSRVVFEDELKMLLKSYYQSQLQALKEEVENIPCSGRTFHSINFKKEVLNLITNLENK